MKKYLFVLSLLLCFYGLSIADTPDNPENAVLIKQIIITTTRVNESVVRKQLLFKEGDVFSEGLLERSKVKLYSLGLFKSLEIAHVYDDSLKGVKITVNAKDGWYIFPCPLFGRNEGVGYGGLFLLEQNLFRDAERIMMFSTFEEGSSYGMFNFILPKTSFRILIDNRSYTEYLYQDGAYNSRIFSGRNINDVGKYGTVVNSYDQDLKDLKFSFTNSLAEKLRATISANTGEIQYSNPLVSLPSDSGRVNSLQLSLNYGNNNGASQDFLSNFGRIFGLGMADLDERLKPLYCRRSEVGYGASYETSSDILGSDFDFNKVAANFHWMEIYCNESSLSLGLKSGYGFNLPFSQLFATNRRDGMLGSYAREYRGTELALTNLSYRYMFFKNRTGHLNGEIFTEYAETWDDTTGKAKEGVGFNLSYSFWRFPIPLGFGYTYSFDDNDWQASFAIGGMF